MYKNVYRYAWQNSQPSFLNWNVCNTKRYHIENSVCVHWRSIELMNEWQSARNSAHWFNHLVFALVIIWCKILQYTSDSYLLIIHIPQIQWPMVHITSDSTISDNYLGKINENAILHAFFQWSRLKCQRHMYFGAESVSNTRALRM